MSPAGAVDIPFTFAFSKMQATTLNGGSVKIVDSRTFAASQTIAAAEVTVEPGAIRSVYISFLRPITPSLTQYTLQRAPRETSLNICLKPFDAYFVTPTVAPHAGRVELLPVSFLVATAALIL